MTTLKNNTKIVQLIFCLVLGLVFTSCDYLKQISSKSCSQNSEANRNISSSVSSSDGPKVNPLKFDPTGRKHTLITRSYTVELSKHTCHQGTVHFNTEDGQTFAQCHFGDSFHKVTNIDFEPHFGEVDGLHYKVRSFRKSNGTNASFVGLLIEVELEHSIEHFDHSIFEKVLQNIPPLTTFITKPKIQANPLPKNWHKKLKELNRSKSLKYNPSANIKPNLKNPNLETSILKNPNLETSILKNPNLKSKNKKIILNLNLGKAHLPITSQVDSKISEIEAGLQNPSFPH